MVIDSDEGPMTEEAEVPSLIFSSPRKTVLVHEEENLPEPTSEPSGEALEGLKKKESGTPNSSDKEHQDIDRTMMTQQDFPENMA